MLAYENLANHAGKGMHVLYLDGTVVWRESKPAKALIAQLQAGKNPPQP